MLLACAAILVGFTILMFSADRFILGASAIARRLGVSALLVGLTIVALGTSLPELLVSLMAALSNKPALALGNAIGSNIANTGLVLGVTSMVTPMVVHSKLLKREFPILTGIMILLYLLMRDMTLSQTDGVILLFGLAALFAWLIYIGIKEHQHDSDPLSAEYNLELPEDIIPLSHAIAWFVVGLILLPISSHITVWGAVECARYFGISELIIGLTIVALGTSLPELAASIMGALKGEYDIAVGNVIGSNMFNLLGVVGLPSALTGIDISPIVIYRDFACMIIITLLLYVTAYGHKKTGTINRYEGAVLLLSYLAYYFILYETS